MTKLIRNIGIFAVCIVCFSVEGYPTGLTSTRGEVVRRISGCDYFLVETTGGFDLLEWYGGHDPDKGDILVGNFESYGFHDVIDDNVDDTIRIYTEDYLLSKSSATEKLLDKCE